MAITIPSDETIEAQALAYKRNRFPSRDLGTEGFLGLEARAEALLVLGLLKAVADADKDAVPSSSTSEARLDEWATLFGLPTATAGVYGRKAAVASSGGAGTLTGTKGTAYVAGATLTAPDGVTIIELVDNETIPGSPPGTGSTTAAFRAVTAGTAGNLAAQTVLTWVSPPAGADTTVTLTAKLSGGADKESAAELLARLLARLQTPPKGGTAADYRTWGQTVSGVPRAYSYPHRNGLGSVDLVITAAGTGTSRDPGATTASDVDDYINGSSTEEGQRPVTAQGYRTVRPYMPAYPTGGLTIRCRMVPAAAKYNFDWTDTATTYQVGLYESSGGAVANGAKLTLNVDAPASLTSAVDAGSKPRLQILSTGTSFPAAPVQVRVVGYSGGGNRILELENPLPTGFVAPNVGDRVFAGGPGVDTATAAILAYVDALGPSRQSGYAHALDVWEDTVSIARLTQIALDALDGSARYFKNIVSSGVTIAVGNGAAAATDATASDTSANGPELLYARHIAVTQ